MSILDWYDTNHDGHYDGAEIDRFQLDHAEYPGMFERVNDKYDWNDDDDDDYRYSDSFLDREEKRRETLIEAGSELDFLIDYDDENDNENDDYDYSSRYGDLKLTTPNQEDIATARRLKQHLESNAVKVAPSSNTCYDCAFWRGERPTTTRAWGCHIFYAIAIEYGGSMPDIVPSQDSKVCRYFAQGVGQELTCYDCKYWPEGVFADKRRKRCAIWTKVVSDNMNLHAIARNKFGSAVSFNEFESDSPATDTDVCIDFEIRDNWKPVVKPLGIKTKVAGIGFNDRFEVWDSLLDRDDWEIILRREPDNDYDSNAIAVYADGAHGGYIPKDDAETLAPLMDSGKETRVTERKIKKIEKKNGEEFFVVNLTIEVAMNADECDPTEETPYDERIRKAAKKLPPDVYPATPEILAAADLPSSEVLGYLKKFKQ